MIPTIKTLTKYDIPEPKTVRGLMDGSIDPESFASVQRWASECYNRPSQVELALCAINEVINGFGVDGIPDEDYREPGISYVNRGDAYTPTIIHNGQRWIIGDWGSILDKQDNV